MCENRGLSTKYKKTIAESYKVQLKIFIRNGGGGLK